MIKNVIKLSEAKGGRLDPHQFHEERIEIIRKICSGSQYRKLKEVIRNVKQITTDLSDSDIYIGLENIVSNIGEYIPTKEKETISSAAIFSKGNILFPKLRPYLNKVYYADFDGKCSTEFHVFQAKDIDAEFLTIMLRSRLILNQTKHLITGNTLPRLQTSDVENLIIPFPSKDIQQQIVDLYNHAVKEKQAKEQEAKALLDSIDNYLLKELGIELPENIRDERYFEVNVAELIGGRLDPIPYNGKSKSLRKMIAGTLFPKTPLKKLIIHSISGDWGIDETEVTNEDYIKCIVIRSTEFDNKYNLKLDNSRVKYRNIKKDKLSKMEIQAGDLLIEKSGGSPDQPVGRIAILTKDIVNTNTVCYSNFIHKIKVDDSQVIPEYVCFFLKTMYNIGFTESMQSQTNGIRNLIMNEYFGQEILLPERNKQQQIVDVILSMQEKAKQLQMETMETLEKAKKEVERMIENGNDNNT